MSTATETTHSIHDSQNESQSRFGDHAYPWKLGIRGAETSHKTLFDLLYYLAEFVNKFGPLNENEFHVQQYHETPAGNFLWRAVYVDPNSVRKLRFVGQSTTPAKQLLERIISRHRGKKLASVLHDEIARQCGGAYGNELASTWLEGFTIGMIFGSNTTSKLSDDDRWPLLQREVEQIDMVARVTMMESNIEQGLAMSDSKGGL